MSSHLQTAKRLSIARLLDGLYGLSFPFWTILWREVGLSHTMAMMTQFVFGIIWVLLELPTGFIADRFGRRICILGGMFLKLLGHILYLNAHTPLMVFVAEILLASGFSFISGALVALMFDSLQTSNNSHQFKKLNAVGEIGNFALAAIAALFSSIIGMYGARYAIGSMLVVDLLQILVLYPIIEAPHQVGATPNFLSTLSRIKIQLVNNFTFRVLIFAPPILIAVAHGTTWFTEPYLTLIGFNRSDLGYCFAGILSLSSLATLYIRRLKSSHSERTALILTPTLSLIGSSFASFFMSPLGALGLVSSFMVRAVTPVMFAEALNREIPSDIRATALSFQNLVNRLLVVSAMLIAGVIADHFSIQAVFIWTAILSTLALFAGIVVRRVLIADKLSSINK